MSERPALLFNTVFEIKVECWQKFGWQLTTIEFSNHIMSDCGKIIIVINGIYHIAARWTTIPVNMLFVSKFKQPKAPLMAPAGLWSARAAAGSLCAMSHPRRPAPGDR